MSAGAAKDIWNWIRGEKVQQLWIFLWNLEDMMGERDISPVGDEQLPVKKVLKWGGAPHYITASGGCIACIIQPVMNQFAMKLLLDRMISLLFSHLSIVRNICWVHIILRTFKTILCQFGFSNQTSIQMEIYWFSKKCFSISSALSQPNEKGSLGGTWWVG